MSEQEFKKLWDNKSKFILNGKKYSFKEAYQKTIDTILPTVVFNEGTGYYQKETLVKQRWGEPKLSNCVYNVNTCNNKEEWSWMQSINTNYSCGTYLVVEVNRLIDLYKLDYDMLNFTIFDNFPKEFVIFYKVLNQYKNDVFQPTDVTINNVFNQMKFKTQETWFDGKIAEIFLAQNGKKFINDIVGFDFDFARGNDDDMNNGVDLKFTDSNNNVFTIQNKKGGTPREEGDYYVFWTYYKKSYSNLNFFVIANYKDNVLYVVKNLGNYNNGIYTDPNNYSKLKIRKDLIMAKIDETDELDNSLSMILYKLLIYCSKNNIEYSMGIPTDGINKITFNEKNSSVYVEYINFNDETFLDKVNEVFLKVNKNKTTD